MIASLCTMYIEQLLTVQSEWMKPGTLLWDNGFNNWVASFKTPYVIYKKAKKIEPKSALFRLDFYSIFTSKPQHIVVEL